MESQKRAMDDASGLQMRMSELQERERNLLQRENTLAEQIRDFQSRPYPAYGNDGYGYNTANPLYSSGNQQPPYTQNNGSYRNNNLQERAQTDGIRLNTAGSIRGNTTLRTPREQIATDEYVAAAKSTPANNSYNVGSTLFKSAFIVLCIVAFESFIVYFMQDYLGINALYPAIWFTVGFVAFLVCAILYACKYKPNVKRKKYPSYILSAAIIFVIAVIVVTMIAVYFKAQVSVPSELLSYVIIPVIYLVNILIFVAFYYTFSLRSNRR